MDLKQVDFKGLKDAVKELNGSGLLDSKIKFTAVKKEVLVDSFCDAVEGIDEDKVNEIPDSAFDFYNNLVEMMEEDDAGEDAGDAVEEEDGEVEEEDATDEVEEEEETVEEEDEPEPQPKKKPAKKKPASKKKPKPEPEPAEESGGTGRVRKATVRMSAKVDGGYIRVGFKDGEDKKWKLPKKTVKGYKDKLKALVKTATDFAIENDATIGQQKAVRKAFTRAGYHITK